MVTIKNGTKFDEDLISHILNPSKPNIKFHNITFDCETIEDASGNVFVWACKREREKGKWIEKEIRPDFVASTAIDEWQSAKCSVCGKYHITPYLYYFDDFNYCPNCGSYNGGDNNEVD